MTNHAHTSDEPRDEILGSLRAENGKGIVRVEDHFDAPIDDMWSAITDPRRLADWHSEVEGDLRPGGTFRIYVAADDWEGEGRVDFCDPPRRLVITTRESEESFRKGQGVPPFDTRVEASLHAHGEGTALVVEVSGLPLEPLPYFGVGWQIHVEKLGAYLAGRELGDTEPRWDELIPAYQALAAALQS